MKKLNLIIRAFFEFPHWIFYPELLEEWIIEFNKNEQ